MTASVPVGGSTAEMSHYSLVRPPGVAITLPHARAELPLGVHQVREHGLRTVTIVERPEGGIQIRFSFHRDPPEIQALEVDRAEVRVRVADPDPTP